MASYSKAFNNLKLLWGFDICTDHLISTYLPSIVVVNDRHTGILIDVVIPAVDSMSVKKPKKSLQILRYVH